MIVPLSKELALELERVGDEPLRVENPFNHKRYVILPEAQFEAGRLDESTPSGDWSEAKNARRFALIDKEIAGTILPSEVSELQQLQREADEFLRRVAPLPLAASRELHEQLRQAVQNSPRS